jgi:hypothetical protein
MKERDSMAKVVIRSGACGFTTTVTAVKGEDRKIHITIDSDCEQVRAMQEDIATLERMDAFKGFLENPVYRSAAKRLKHVACPVPSGIIKALEVAAGLNLPKDATIVFEKDGK